MEIRWILGSVAHRRSCCRDTCWHFHVLVLCAALEHIASWTAMVLNMSVVFFGNGISRRATTIPT